MPLLSAPPLTPGFMVVHANRLEDLRGVAIEWMRRHPLAPLENETLLVQSNGIGQWLKLALAADPHQGGAGIAAALDVTLPARFLWQSYRTVLEHAPGDTHGVPETSPFDKSRLVWRLLRLLPTLLKDDVFAPLARFLDADPDQRKRYQLAERLADLFDQYQVYRADWLEAWARGDDVLITARGQAIALDEQQRWQPALWRALRDDVAATQGEAGLAGSRAEVHRRFLAAAEALSPETRPPGLPRRLIVFGISSLPQQTLEALAALSRCCQVVLCVHNPCQFYWADIIEHKDLLRATRYRQTRKAGMPGELDVLGEGDADEALHLHAQPLLAAWGKQGRDYLRLLDEHDDTGGYQQLFEQQSLRIDIFEPFGHADTPRLLHQLQDDIRELRPLEETRKDWPAVDATHDDSLVFHLAHSAQREVEILHDQLLAAFSADATLRPRDIIVMVPDIDQYAPHIDAVFGQYPQHDARHIPFTLSDQASRQRQPLMIALETLVRLPEMRLSVSDIMGLLEVPALRQRFGIDEADLAVLARWIEGAGIRWGLGAAQRERLDLPGGLEHNTWAFGLRRLLLGYAVGSGERWQGIEPYDDIGGLDAAVAGRLATLLEKLEDAWHSLCRPASAADWVTRLRGLLETFFDTDDPSEVALIARLEAGLEQLFDSTQEARLGDALPLSMVREHWLSQVDEHSLSQRFLAGAVNFATLMPMRAIPFRRVCLLGMNDGDYPRTQPPLDFDLMGQDYRPGDRSRREDDRYLFLEALLSARDQLYVSWMGRSQLDNDELPPSVLVGQLRDHLAAGWQARGDTPLLKALTTEHPLQPFSRAYFSPETHTDSPASARLFTYAAEWREAHDTDANMAETPDAPLPPFGQEKDASAVSVTLVQLGRFLREPARAFFNDRLGVYFEQEDAAELDVEPFALNGLENWQLQDRLIAAQRRAVDNGEPRLEALGTALERLSGQGVLAYGAMGERMRESLAEPMEALFDEYAKALEEWPQPVEGGQPVEHTFTTADGGAEITLTGRLDELRQAPGGLRCRLVLSSSSLIDTQAKETKYRWQHLLRPWVAHLAGNADAPMTTQLISKAGSVRLAPLEIADARALLQTLLDRWQDAMAAPLPLAAHSAFAWRTAQGSAKKDPEQAARSVYDGGYHHSGEVEQSAYLARLWPDFTRLFAAESAHGHTFVGLCEALYAPLYEHIKSTPDATRAGEKP
ncbi:MAG: exodeoxyribonuclease V subunit gamma [Halomonas sp.]|nr:exodeoxyribonuclease V subunit gamma [Halomonas sp.]MDN6298005.1 exodeoxyribonuclease V subunit gamma [Halomonas sp.]MDN6315456.1 exodeoxyribonuclease V subunit gamma [Halomonas sp.]MDN6335820.1 exodeoxyribonuclease V subunit gamma [Halomonas sp.]